MKNELLKRILSSLAILPITIFFIIKGSIFFSFFLVIFFIATSYEWININKKIMIKISGVLFLSLSSYSAYLLRENGLSGGINIFLFVFIICIFTDVGGYTFGKFFKGPKLTKISPNKTISGSLGSFCFSIIPLLVFYNIDSSEYLLSTNNFLMCLLTSLACQLGDLFISYQKRKAKIKNTGKLLPGHGGMLDRIDGIIFSIPFIFIIYVIGFTDFFETYKDAILYAIKSQ